MLARWIEWDKAAQNDAALKSRKVSVAMLSHEEYDNGIKSSLAITDAEGVQWVLTICEY